MRLQELLSKVTVKSLGGPHSQMDPEIRSIEYDSRRVKNGSFFFAIEGTLTDGHLYLDEALQKGAAAVASEREAPAGFPVPWIQVETVRAFLALLADRFYDYPSQRLQLAGVTGTNGKTTTAFLIHSILEQQSPALRLGTIKTKVGDWEVESGLTTPEAVDIQRTLAQALQSGCRTGALEVSSHALFLHRVYRCHFPVAIFTNLSQDHLDFHSSLEEYFQAKCLLFQSDYNPGLKHAVLNADDPFSARIQLPPHTHQVTFGFSENSEVHPLAHKTSVEGTEVDLKFFDQHLSLSSRLAGEYNLYNMMAAATAASLLGIPDDQIREGVARLRRVPGRFEKVEIGHLFTVIVDYAHTPNALENVLKLCRQLSRGRVLCVFGCGGDRDRAKRPLMGAIAVRDADLAIVTSDNPRYEDPEKIIQEIRVGIPAGFSNCEIIVDRREAIARALKLAQKGDIVLVAGKGHEAYQEIQGKRIRFDDREVIKEIH
ncbi:MAG: UDP-N-acetylmuramoyl-L-alanyl-D-glutamate--2,6-diaminopimelate ligase [Acidobacteriota bacterium]